MFFRELAQLEGMEIGLILLGYSGSPDVGIGTILASFQSKGNFPVIKNLLNRLIRLSAITGAVSLILAAEILSAPVDLLGLSEEIKN